MAISSNTFQIMLNFENHEIFHSMPMKIPEDVRFISLFFIRKRKKKPVNIHHIIGLQELKNN